MKHKYSMDEFYSKVGKILDKGNLLSKSITVSLEKEIVQDILKGYEFGRFEKFRFEDLPTGLFNTKYITDTIQELKTDSNEIEQNFKQGNYSFSNLFPHVYIGLGLATKSIPKNVITQAGECYGIMQVVSPGILRYLSSELFDEGKGSMRFLTDKTKNKVITFYNNLCDIATSSNTEEEKIASMDQLMEDYGKEMKINYLKSTRKFLDGMFEYLSSYVEKTK